MILYPLLLSCLFVLNNKFTSVSELYSSLGDIFKFDLLYNPLITVFNYFGSYGEGCKLFISIISYLLLVLLAEIIFDLFTLIINVCKKALNKVVD